MLCKNPKETKVNIIDSIMGSGKTSWAIQFMEGMHRSYQKFLYITPFKSEVERVIGSVNSDFKNNH